MAQAYTWRGAPVRCLALSDPCFQATTRGRLARTSSYEYCRYIRRSATAMGQAACRADDARSYRVWLVVRTWLKRPHAAERKIVDATSSSSYLCRTCDRDARLALQVRPQRLDAAREWTYDSRAVNSQRVAAHCFASAGVPCRCHAQASILLVMSMMSTT
jgi:hypothetical protein